MRKIFLLLTGFLFTASTFVFAADNASDVASAVISGFKEKKYSQSHDRFYVPPYYSQQDINDDKACFIQAMNNFNNVLGDLEKYSEIPLSEHNYECLGELCGMSEWGSYPGPFTVEEGGPVFLKVYKADFSKIKGVNMYVFVINWKDKFLATQFGVTFPSESFADMDAAFPLSGEGGKGGDILTSLMLENSNFFCEKFPNRKVKVFADRVNNDVRGVPREVEYDLMTKEGQKLLDTEVYGSDPDERSEPQNSLLQLPKDAPAFSGERVFHLLTTKNEEIAVRITCNSDKELQNIAIEPPKREGEVSEDLFVESQAGFLIKINAVWKNGAMESFHIGPYIHPFRAMTYYSCPKEDK
jgi:hypothetical protein